MASGVPEAGVADALSYTDCMAAQGYIVAFEGQLTDIPAFNTTAGRCQAQGPVLQSLAECLRAEGLDVPDPTSAAASSAQPFPPDRAQAAWTTCREDYIAAFADPPELTESVLKRPDCMAAHGWITLVMPVRPADDPAYQAAVASCPL
jgi:hypothetical protein